jgi:hypothetical protein
MYETLITGSVAAGLAYDSGVALTEYVELELCCRSVITVHALVMILIDSLGCSCII